jgi:hypothetical protein
MLLTPERKIESISREVEARTKALTAEIHEHKAETDCSLDVIKQDVAKIRKEMSTEREILQFKAGEELKICNDNIRTVEVKIVEFNDKMNSEISNLKTQIAEGSIINNWSAVVAEVDQATEARIADIDPTTTTFTGIEQHSTQCVSDCNVSCTNTTHLLNVNSVQIRANVSVHSDLVSVPNAAIKELVLPTFSDSNKQVAVQFWREFKKYFKLKQIPYSLKLRLTDRAISDAYSKAWLSAVYHDLKDYEQFRENLTNILWSKPHQSRIRCAIFKDKYSRQEGNTCQLIS